MNEKALQRKRIPVFSGFLKYFPDAVKKVAQLSFVGNEQHNPGQPLHWDKGKSQDEKDALIRHLIDSLDEDTDEDGIWHETKVAWRAMANLQRKCDKLKEKGQLTYDTPIVQESTSGPRDNTVEI